MDPKPLQDLLKSCYTNQLVAETMAVYYAVLPWTKEEYNGNQAHVRM